MSENVRTFEPYPFLSKSLMESDPATANYRIYTSPTESACYAASCAKEALKLAGVPHPYRIVREEPLGQLMLDRKMFQ